MRLDDACEKWNKSNWIRMEILLDHYGIKPLVGIIPHCEDEMMHFLTGSFGNCPYYRDNDEYRIVRKQN